MNLGYKKQVTVVFKLLMNSMCRSDVAQINKKLMSQTIQLLTHIANIIVILMLLFFVKEQTTIIYIVVVFAVIVNAVPIIKLIIKN